MKRSLRASVGRSVWAAGWLLGFGVLASAQTLDLWGAYEAALTGDATIRATRATTQAQRERLPQAQAPLYPNVVMSVGRQHNRLDRTLTDASSQESSRDEHYMSYNQTLTLRQALFRKPLWTGLQQAEMLVKSAEAALDSEYRSLAVRVTAAYLEVLLAYDGLAAVQAQRQATEWRLDAAQKSFAAGSGTLTDIDEAAARLDWVMAQELEAREQLVFNRRRLETLVDRPVAQVKPLDATRMPLTQPEPADLGAWLFRAEADSPELVTLRARRDAAWLEIDKLRGGHYPTLDAVVQLTRSGSESVTTPGSRYVNRVIGLQLNLPLLSGGLVNSTVRQATSEWVRAEENLEAARRDLSLRVHQEYRGVTEGLVRLRALEQALRSAELLVYSNTRAFQAGLRTIVDILDAEQRQQEAWLALRQGRYEYLLSFIRLQALVGADTEAAVQQVNGYLQADGLSMTPVSPHGS